MRELCITLAQLAQPPLPYIRAPRKTLPDVAAGCRSSVFVVEFAFHVAHLRVVPPSTLKGAPERKMERELQ
jgi:hypothetical protein